MPTVFRYGRVSTDKQVLSPEVQAARTKQEMAHRQSLGILPADAVDSGFLGDIDTSRRIPFLHRKMGIHIGTNARPGDWLIVASYDRLIGGPRDFVDTFQWSQERGVKIVFMDLGIDTDTPVGRMVCGILAMVKEYEVQEIRRRTKETVKHRRATGRPSGIAPLGYQIMKIIPAGGDMPVKWFFPWPAERKYAERIRIMRDEMKLTWEQIVLKISKEKLAKPRSGQVNQTRIDAMRYYKAAKEGYPLRDGKQWRPPDFRFKVAKKLHDVIDLNLASA